MENPSKHIVGVRESRNWVRDKTPLGYNCVPFIPFRLFKLDVAHGS